MSSAFVLGYLNICFCYVVIYTDIQRTKLCVCVFVCIYGLVIPSKWDKRTKTNEGTMKNANIDETETCLV